MPKFRVGVRLIKDYTVEVDESTPLEAVMAVVDGVHGPMIEDTESGEYFYPSSWSVKGEDGDDIEFERTELEEMD